MIMASTLAKKFLLCSLYSLLVYCGEVQAQCPQRINSPSINERAQRLAENGEFKVFDKKKTYRYVINLCQKDNIDDVAITQTNLDTKQSYVIGEYHGMNVTGGSDWLLVTYLGKPYNHHCNNSRRRVLFFIVCDQSADTKIERRPRIIEEHTNKGQNVDDICYYLFEMSHSGVCPTPPKTKISPGSVFIIIIVIVGVLYIVLGMLYQRFIVGAKGLEQIPNYLMWREFGTLQADGCNYMCRCKATREPARYKPVDDAIADDDDESGDKDDNLLPM